jgi:hypothetical protein
MLVDQLARTDGLSTLPGAIKNAGHRKAPGMKDN